MTHRTAAAAALLVASILSGCAPGRPFVHEGQQMIEQGRIEEGLARIEKGLSLEPGNHEYRMLVVRQREAQIGGLLARADVQRSAGQLDAADETYRRVLTLDATNPRARSGLDATTEQRKARQRAADRPAQAGPTAETGPPTLRASLRKPVTLDFREANLRTVFDALARSTGINFVFDREVRPDIRVTLSVSNISIEDVIGVLSVTNQLERKTLNDNTVLIYPNTAAKQKDYVDLAVKTFYLENADAKAVFTMLKTVLKSRDLHADEKLNSLTLRDTPDAIRLAGKLIAAHDLAEPEVILEVEVLEVKRSRLSEIGVEPPGKFTVLNIVQNPATVISTATGTTTTVNNTVTSTQLTLDKLRGLSSAAIGIDNPSVNLRAENGDTNILANPRIRVKNRDKARILIGDRVPVITTTSTINVGVAESVSYLDVGLKLEVEPNVFLDNEVGVKVNLEVSNIVREVRSRSGSLTYQIGTRLAATNLRLRDGETQALAGLISDEDRKASAGVPWINELPVLGRLFSTERSDRSKTEIVLLITPRVVRNLAPDAGSRGEHIGGTETAVGLPRLRLQDSGRMAVPPSTSAPRVQPGVRPAAPSAEPEATPPTPPAAPEPAAPTSAAPDALQEGVRHG
jgi:general secretion pathway protein D